MTPYFDRFGVTLFQGDALAVLAALPAASVQAVVTSPPYYSLRAYGTDPVVWDGDPACEHAWGEPHRRISSGGPPEAMRLSGGKATTQDGARFMTAGAFCARCGAWRGELGSEPTPDLFIRHLVAIFAAVRRVLRADGLCWVNIGDSFANPGGSGAQGKTGQRSTRWFTAADAGGKTGGIPPKNLLLIPFRLALALQADGWVVRQTVIWAKGSPMPESVQDRPTTSHEYVFQLAKSGRYYYDSLAIAESATQHSQGSKGEGDWNKHPAETRNGTGATTLKLANRAVRNARSVWTINAQPFSAARLGIDDCDHFAAYPEELACRAIRASTSERGACPACGAPWERVKDANPDRRDSVGRGIETSRLHSQYFDSRSVTTGWRPTCPCPPAEPVPCVILDPFAGSGTTLRAAQRLGRRAVGIELSADYCRIAEARVGRQGPLDFAPDAGTEAAAG